MGLLDGVKLLEVMDNLNGYSLRRRILMKTYYFILNKIRLLEIESPHMDIKVSKG